MYLKPFVSSILKLCILAAVLTSVAPAWAESSADWYYTFRPSDNIQDVGKRFLSNGREWSDIVRYNRIDNVAAIQPGSIIKIPMQWLKFQPQPAKTLSIDGNVLVRNSHLKQYRRLQANTLIHVGYEVMSREGTALIKLADNSIIRVERDTHLSFNRLSHFGETGMVDTRIRLKRGGVISDVAPLSKGSRFEIQTPSAVAAVRGTEFRLRTDGNETQIEVTEGQVEFSHAHGVQSIRAGEGAKVSGQSAVMTKRRLYEPPENSFASRQIGQLPVELSWEPKPSANKYQYELRVDSPSGSIVQQRELTEPKVELNQVKNGEYRVAMRAVDKDGFQGMDEVTPLSIQVSGDRAQLLMPIAESVVESSDLAFQWAVSQIDTKSKLQIARDDYFEDLVIDETFENITKQEMKDKLAPGVYFWRVLSLTAEHIEAQSDPRKVSIRGLMDEVKVLSVNYVENQVGLFWNSVDESNGYVLQISDHESFSRIIREETIRKPSAFLKLTAGKSYYARIKGIPNDLYQSEFGPSEKLFLPEDTESE